MGPRGRIGYILDYIALFGAGYVGFRQVLYSGRAPVQRRLCPIFVKKCRVTRHSRVFCGLTGSQQTLGFWGVTAWYKSLGIRIPKELEFGYPSPLGGLM